MRIYIRILHGKTLELDVNPSDTLASVKAIIRDTEGIPVKLQRLIFSGKQCEDEKSYGEYGVRRESTLHLVVRERKQDSIDTV
jgi:hypothetical protein